MLPQIALLSQVLPEQIPPLNWVKPCQNYICDIRRQEPKLIGKKHFLSLRSGDLAVQSPWVVLVLESWLTPTALVTPNIGTDDRNAYIIECHVQGGFEQVHDFITHFILTLPFR